MANVRNLRDRGFTLIELLVVIGIIGILSTILLTALSTARTKALDTTALQGGMNVNTLIVACDLAGGKVTIPNSETNPTNNICTLGASHGTWVSSPQGWRWVTSVWDNGENNLIQALPTYSNGRYNAMFCGHFVEWSGEDCNANPGLCRLAQGFGCTQRETATDSWR